MSKKKISYKPLIIKYSIEFLVIVFGVLISFNIQTWYEEKKEIKEINDSILTLVDEIESNIFYSEEHLLQLSNMKTVNNLILDNYPYIPKNILIEWHNMYPFGHSYLKNGELRYWTSSEDYENLYLWMITWWNTFAQNEIYFNTLMSSGLLLNINDPMIREEIESVYITKKRRVEVNELLLKGVSDNIFKWVEDQRDGSEKYITREEIFESKLDNQLFNLLEDRAHRIELRIMSLENYIESLKSLKSNIERTL